MADSAPTAKELDEWYQSALQHVCFYGGGSTEPDHIADKRLIMRLIAEIRAIRGRVAVEKETDDGTSNANST